MKNTDLFKLIGEEKKNVTKQLFRDNVKTVCKEALKMTKEYGLVLFSGVLADVVTFSLIPLPIHAVIGTLLCGAVTHANFRHTKRIINMRNNEYRNDINELGRLRENLGEKMSLDASSEITFASQEKSLCQRFQSIVRKDPALVIEQKDNGETIFSFIERAANKNVFPKPAFY